MRRGALFLKVVVCVCLMFGLSASAAQKSGAASGRAGEAAATPPSPSDFVIGPGFGGIGSRGVPALFVGVTTQRFPPGAGALALSHACNEEHPFSRLCEWGDIFRAIPPISLDSEVLVAPNYDTRPVPMCLNPNGGLTCRQSTIARPAACCGFPPPPPQIPSPASITLTPADPQTVTACSDSLEFTATALDGQGAPVAGMPLVFDFPPVVGGTSNPNGVFNPYSGLSDANGQVTTTLSFLEAGCLANCAGGKDCYASVVAHDVNRTVFSNAVSLVDAIP
ncbi:MAG TPA: Ig-like domain-containing protein [Candidatus Polarisedimenticolia bacterium]|nr:Ig-like domain-containing protein [Candidatus Polarisedimenticolia bacterium]